MTEAIALGLPPELTREVATAIGSQPDAMLTDGELAERAAAAGDLLDLLVIGPGVAAPVLVAQRVRATNATVPLLIIAAPADLERHRRLLRYAAFVGQDVHLYPSSDVDGICRAARDAAKRARERRRYRTSRELLRSVSPPPAFVAAPLARAGARTQTIADASAVLEAATDLAATLTAIGQVFVPMAADVCLIDLVHDDGTVRRARPVHVSHLPGDVIARLAAYAASREGEVPAARVLRTYRGVLIAELDDAQLRRMLRDDEHVRIAQRIGARSAIAVPLVAHARLLGAVTLVATEGRPRYTDEDLQLATELARRCAMALHGARVYETARAAAEAERQARERAERALQARDLFLSVASHELRTPLTALLGRIQLALRRLDRAEPDAAGARDALARAVTQGERLARLLAQIFDASRTESGMTPLDRRKIDLATVLADTLEIARAVWPSHTWELEGATAVVADVDPTRIEQAVLNLLDNAARYSPAGSRVAVRLTPAEGGATIEVEDEGPGVPEDERDRVFGRFYQIGGRAAGMGLGLYIAKRFIEQHGGRIHVTSGSLGRGARFIVELPTTPADGRPAEGGVAKAGV